METYRIPMKHASCYLVKVNDYYVAMDAGWAGCMNEYLKEVHLQGIRPEQIQYLFLTHFHPDHAGLAENIKHYGAQLILFAHQMPYLSVMERMIGKNSSYLPLNLQTSLTLNIEESDAFFAERNIPARAVRTPGHSEDSISLVFSDGSAFIGDLCLPELLMEDDSESKASWDRLRDMGVTMVYPAHGAAFRLDG